MGPDMEVGYVLEKLGYLSVLGNFVWGPPDTVATMALFCPSVVLEFWKLKPLYSRFPISGRRKSGFLLNVLREAHFISECLFDQVCETWVIKLVFA